MTESFGSVSRGSHEVTTVGAALVSCRGFFACLQLRLCHDSLAQNRLSWISPRITRLKKLYSLALEGGFVGVCVWKLIESTSKETLASCLMDAQ